MSPIPTMVNRRVPCAPVRGRAGTPCLVLVTVSDVIDVSTLSPACRRYSAPRSEEHTSELQSRFDLVCRLLLEKKKTKNNTHKHVENSLKHAETETISSISTTTHTYT